MEEKSFEYFCYYCNGWNMNEWHSKKAKLMLYSFLLLSIYKYESDKNVYIILNAVYGVLCIECPAWGLWKTFNAFYF